MLLLYLLFFAQILVFEASVLSFIAYVAMGPLAILIGLNIAHDAAHGAISQNRKINNFFLLTFDFLGANSYIWKSRHVFSHHSFPNIVHEDADLGQSELVRIFPSDKIQKHQRYQHLYMPLLYLLYTANWLVYRDFRDFFRERIGSFRHNKLNKIEVFKLITFKVIYFSYILVLPMLFSDFNWWQILLGYLFMNWAAGITITLALVPSHVASTSEFPLPDKNGVMPYPWSHHQVLTTTDYATSSPIINYLMGGFNHHITHHLFPKICHVHYTKITPIIKETMAEFGLRYNYEASLLNAYLSHFKLLKRNGWVEWQKLENAA